MMRPVLRYHGGKFRLAPWIISHFPTHGIYVEPFGGGGSVLLRKEAVQEEVYNDLDGDVVNVFRVLRDKELAQALFEALTLTPYAREEYLEAYEHSDDPVERARRIIVRSFMGQGSNACTKATPNGWRSKRMGGGWPVRDWNSYPKEVEGFYHRFKSVTIENRDATEVIKMYDSNDTFFYIDPPYMRSTRTTTGDSYKHEMTAGDHINLRRALDGIMGKAAVSGYRSEVYDALYSEWRQVEKETTGEAQSKRTEILWMNY